MPKSKGRGGDYETYRKQLKSLDQHHEFPAISMLHGPNRFLHEWYLKEAKASWLAHYSEVPRSLDGKDLTTQTMQNHFEQSDLFAAANLYLVRGLETNKSTLKHLRSLNPPKTSSNSFILSYCQSASAPLLKEAARLHAAIIKCDDPPPYQISTCIKDIGLTHGLRFSKDAIDLIVAGLGSDLSIIANEVKKLSLLRSGESQLLDQSAEDIVQHIEALKEDNVFALDNLLQSSSYGKSQALLFDLLERGESPIAVLNVIARHCRHSLQLKFLVDRGVPAKDLWRYVRLPSFIISRYLESAARRKPQVLKAAIIQCGEADQILKSRSISPYLVLSSIIDTLMK